MKLAEIKRAVVILVIFLVLLTGVYPAVVTLVGKIAFPGKAGGSLVERNGAVYGSSLIGQPFSDPKYFWPRPSATAPAGRMPYDPMASGGSNLGPTNPALLDETGAAARQLRDSGVSGPLPIDLVTSSASGLDPDITVEAAEAQAARVGQARHMSAAQVEQLINAHKQGRTFGFLGRERVNVLELNLALDAAG